MRRQVRLTIICFVVTVLTGCAHKQKTVAKLPSGNQDEVATRVFNDVAASGRFNFAHQSFPLCTIMGTEGPCGVEAFAHGETTEDDSRYTCGKLDKASYVGRCINGKLDGFSLVNVEGSRKSFPEAYISYFHEGRIAYPALTSSLSGTKNFGVDEERMSYGCVYFGEWDKTNERCALFTEIYGKELFTETNAQALRERNFDLNSYRAKFIQFIELKH